MFSTRSVVLQRIAPLLFVCLWSSAFIAIRGGLPDGSPLFFLTSRFTLATAVHLAVAAIIRTGRAAVWSIWRSWLRSARWSR